MLCGLIYCKSRIMNRDIIAAPHAHCLSGLPLAVATGPTNLKWLAIVSHTQRDAQSREAVSNRFAFRVALGDHPITASIYRFLGLPPWEAAGRFCLVLIADDMQKVCEKWEQQKCINRHQVTL